MGDALHTPTGAFQEGRVAVMSVKDDSDSSEMAARGVSK